MIESLQLSPAVNCWWLDPRRMEVKIIVLLLAPLLMGIDSKTIPSRQFENLRSATTDLKAENVSTTEVSIYGEGRGLRTKRSFSMVLTALNVVCSVGKTIHHAGRINGWGFYGTLNAEMDFYTTELKKIKLIVPCRKAVLVTLKSNLMTSFELFEYSVVKVGAVVETYDDLNQGLAIFKDLEKEYITKIDISGKAIDFVEGMTINENTLVNSGSFKAWLTVGGDVATDMGLIGAIELTNAISGLFEKVADGDLMDSIVSNGVQEVMSEFKDVFKGAMSAVNIGLKLVKLADCIRDHYGYYTDHVAQRDLYKKQYDSAKIALKELDAITDQITDAVNRFNNQTDKLVEFTNDFLNIFNSTCKTSSATLRSDLGELKGFVDHMKENFDSKVIIENTVKMAKQLAMKSLDMMKAFLPAQQFKIIKETTMAGVFEITPSSKASYDAMRMQFPDMEIDRLILKMKQNGFTFPKENWTEWTQLTPDTIIDHACSCEDPSSKCIHEESRTCKDNCLGPSQRQVDLCHVNMEDKFHFFKMCKGRDNTYRGSCVTVANNSIEAGEVAGYYTSSEVSQAQCYKDCKALPGMKGCEFVRGNCFLGDCTGDCFAFKDEVASGDNIPGATCYDFSTATMGEPAPEVLRGIFDATQHEMSGDVTQGYNTQDFNAMMLSMLKIDKDLVKSQENGWNEIIRYQQSKIDRWGSNPSSFAERNMMSLTIGNLSMEVIEPCNFASNWGYYHLMMSSSSFPWMKKETKKALGQASAGLALSSSFFHGSHTKLGQDLDNLMIKIMAFILHQSYMELLEVSPQTESHLMDLKFPGRRNMTGLQMAQFMTDLFRKHPASTWANKIRILDIPRYELTFSAIAFTIATHLGYKGSNIEFGGKQFMKKFLVPDSDINFVTKSFLPELRTVIAKKDSTFMERPDIYNSITTAFRLIMAFPFQETYDSKLLNALKLLLSPKNLSTINNLLTSRSTLPLIQPLKSGGKASCRAILGGGGGNQAHKEEFPGKQKCMNTQPHSLWHLQSAKGMLDLFQFIDEIIGKQVDQFKAFPEHFSEDSDDHTP